MTTLGMRKTQVIALVGGSLLAGVLLAPQLAQAQTRQNQQMQTRPMQSSVHPCPSIYYEDPYDSNVLVPDGCQPNSISRALGIDQGDTPPGITDPDYVGSLGQQPMGQQPMGQQPLGQGGLRPITPPLPETRENAIAVVPMLSDQLLNVRLMNSTNVPLTYEVLGHTDQRTLEPQTSVFLTNVPVPTTITAIRQDDGLLDILVTGTDEGMLELSLQEDRGLDDTQGVIRIQDDGQVFTD